MAAPNSQSQYLLELVNDARLDPMGNAARYITSYVPLTSSDPDIRAALTYFGVIGSALETAYRALVPVMPVAWNPNLADAAAAHNGRMIAADEQSHQLPGEASLGTRASSAGYSDWSRVGENIYAYSDSVLYGHAGFMVDWGNGPDGMQSPAGHRINIMNAAFREVGIAISTESNPSTAVGPLVITQDFGARFSGPDVFVLGVAYTDADRNNFYSVGEGLGTLGVSATGASTTSAASGGYVLGLNAGPATITLTGANLAAPITVTGTFADGDNIKIDVVDGDTVRVSDSVTIGGGASRIEVIGATGQRLAAGDGDQEMFGHTGNDTLLGNRGGDLLDGGLGNDTLIGEGAVLPTANALAVQRLYIATLARGPDDAGWAGWTSQMDGGQTLQQIATGFVNSPEFSAKYGASLSNEAFVTLLYQNVLHRAPDAQGLAGWTGALNGGASRESIVTGFSESQEFINATDAVVNAGQVYRLYGATLAREPDAGGFVGWTDELSDGEALATVAGGFVNSQEFINTYGALSNADFVTLLYRNVLGRAPDAGGLTGWVGDLNNGTSRTSVVLGFSESAEYKQATNEALESFVKATLTAWNDTIEGDGGNDHMAGGIGSDQFVFRASGVGSDNVYDLEPWDTLRFEGYGYATAAAAHSHMQQAGDDVLFADRGQTITFHDATLDILRGMDLLLA